MEVNSDVTYGYYICCANLGISNKDLFKIKISNMARIYLDSNVFSNLKVAKDESHRILAELLEKYKDSISLFFSHAHIRDKKKDASDHKFEDFIYMETLTKDNYLSYHAINQNTSFYLATPQMVFEDESHESLDEILDFFEPDKNDEDQLNTFKTHLSSALDMTEIKVEQTMIESGVEKEVIDALFNGKEGNPSLLDITKGIGNLTRNIISDGLTYRNLRNLIDTGLGDQFNEIRNDKYSLNDAFKNTFFQKTFVEYIKDTIYIQDKTRIPYYYFYMLSYNVIDMLGISKEKLKKNNGFGNILNDGLHSYYARYCDFLVTSDKGLREKSSILYNMYEVSTIIVSVEEFIELLPEIALDTDSSAKDFFAKLRYDIKNSQRMLHKRFDDGKEIYRFGEISKYFNFFDAILEEISESSTRYILCKSNTSCLSEPNYREMGQIINRVINLFGEDSSGIGYFDFEKETSETYGKIQRNWNFDELEIFLGNEPQIGKFALVVTMLKK